MNNDFKQALNRIGDALFTRRCRICGEVVELDSDFCEKCDRVERIALPRCDYCGASKDCCNCKKHKNEYKRIIAPFYYEDSIENAVNRCKSSNMPFLAKEFARQISISCKEEYCDIHFDCITFVPMTGFDSFKRGFNQSQLIAKELSSLICVDSVKLLKKIRRTKPQKTQRARQRKVNVYGAFDLIDKDFVKDKTILLVDDVKTTGSTLNECAKMLKIYGAKDVYCAVFALVSHFEK